MVNTILTTKCIIMPISIFMLYSIYKINKKLNDVLHIKQTIDKIHNSILHLENKQTDKHKLVRTVFTNTEILTINDSSNSNSNSIIETENNNSISEISTKLTIDSTVANSTSNIEAIQTDEKINKQEDEHNEIQDYEYIESKPNDIVNRKKSNSMTEAIWNGITENIIYF
jgi:hypothetical protein